MYQIYKFYVQMQKTDKFYKFIFVAETRKILVRK